MSTSFSVPPSQLHSVFRKVEQLKLQLGIPVNEIKRKKAKTEDWYEAVDGGNKGEKVGIINYVFHTVLVIIGDFILKYSFLFDSGSSIYVCHTLSRFNNFRRTPRDHYAICRSDRIIIQGYDEVDVVLKDQKGCKCLLCFYNIVYCSDFPINLVSLEWLEERGFDWKHWNG